MRDELHSLPRRRFLAAVTAALAAAPASGASAAPASARIAITFDLEMSRNFPTWEQTHWDYEKGNLDDATKRYAVEAARRVKAHGGVLHFFLVGRALEQENADWLKQLLADGHPIGNHTYDHVNVKATKPADIQFRFLRAPWLIEGRAPAEVVRDNIRQCSAAMRSRLGIDPVGFRTPGGFRDGLADRPDVQAMLRELGFTWCSSKYPGHKIGAAGEKPDGEVFASIVCAQAGAQPFRYAGGLVEIPMSPVSDIGAFRTGRWKLDWFLEAIRRAVESAIQQRAVFDFIAHPSCLGVVDPECKTVELICELVKQAGRRAVLTDLNSIAQRIA